jgi:4-diphosphocytidyl-2-C-methyl-D-erythritol kinase
VTTTPSQDLAGFAPAKVNLTLHILGGGSSDAAAALRLLARQNGLSPDDERLYAAARATGADVPVCVAQSARMMRGVGEILSGPVALPKLPAVLINPGVAVPTKDVFATLAAPAMSATPTPDDFVAPAMSVDALVSAVAQRRNDLEAPAIKLQPVIADVLAALHGCAYCRLARMSGSGATCFGLFSTAAAAQDAARDLAARHPGWWVRAVSFS